jgi:hypothetical protein
VTAEIEAPGPVWLEAHTLDDDSLDVRIGGGPDALVLLSRVGTHPVAAACRPLEGADALRVPPEALRHLGGGLTELALIRLRRSPLHSEGLPGTVLFITRDATWLTLPDRTHVGMKRAHNEDSLRLFREENLFIVADGMGGHASGEVASQMSVETLAEFFRATSEDDEITWPYKMDKGRKYEENRVITGIKLSNRRSSSPRARDSKLKGMGTTIVVTFFVNDGCYIGHVGDSRVYRFRNGKLTQLTEDHSLLNDYIKMKPPHARRDRGVPAQERHRAGPRHERDRAGRRLATRSRSPGTSTCSARTASPAW